MKHFVIAVAVFCTMTGHAIAQETTHYLYLAPEGTRISRYIPDRPAQQYSDSIVTGFRHIAAMQFNDLDTAFYVVDQGDSTGRGCRIVTFPADGYVLDDRIPRVTSFPLADGSAPADIMFLDGTRAYVSESGAHRINVLGYATGTSIGAIPLTGAPHALVRLSLNRALVVCADTLWATTHVTLLDTDGDSVLGDIVLTGIGVHAVRDRDFHVHVLTRQPDGESRVTIVNRDLTIDTFLKFSGDFSEIGITAGIEPANERVLLAHGVIDSFMQQYNPLTRQTFPRFGPQGQLGIGYGPDFIAVEPDQISVYGVQAGGGFYAVARVLTSHTQKYTAYLDVTPIVLRSGLSASVSSPGTARLSAAPQPCSGRLSLSAAGMTRPSLRITDMLGRDMLTTESGDRMHWEINVARFAPGAYLAVARDGGRSATRLIVVQ